MESCPCGTLEVGDTQSAITKAKQGREHTLFPACRPCWLPKAVGFNRNSVENGCVESCNALTSVLVSGMTHELDRCSFLFQKDVLDKIHKSVKGLFLLDWKCSKVERRQLGNLFSTDVDGEVKWCLTRMSLESCPFLFAALVDRAGRWWLPGSQVLCYTRVQGWHRDVGLAAPCRMLGFLACEITRLIQDSERGWRGRQGPL